MLDPWPMQQSCARAELGYEFMVSFHRLHDPHPTQTTFHPLFIDFIRPLLWIFCEFLR
jgi:hypothetical protein